jgi:hypothetical protein
MFDERCRAQNQYRASLSRFMASHASIPTLSTERLVLRAWREEDLPAFAALNADPRVAEFLPKCLERAESDALAERIAAHFRQHGCGLWALEVRGGAPFIGFAGLAVPGFEAHFTPCLEVGWRLAFAHWGRATPPRRRGGCSPTASDRSGAPRSCRSRPAGTAARARSWNGFPCGTIRPTTSSTPPCPRAIRSGRMFSTVSIGGPMPRRNRAGSLATWVRSRRETSESLCLALTRGLDQHGASFDKLRMRYFLCATKIPPHPL